MNNDFPVAAGKITVSVYARGVVNQELVKLLPPAFVFGLEAKHPLPATSQVAKYLDSWREAGAIAIVTTAPGYEYVLVLDSSKLPDYDTHHDGFVWRAAFLRLIKELP